MFKPRFSFLLLVTAAVVVSACRHSHHGGKEADTQQEQIAQAEPKTPTASPTTPKTSNSPLQFAFFLESSGSMFAYSGTSSSFRQVFYELLTRMPDATAKHHSINYITDKVYPTNLSSTDFMRDPDPFASARKMGVKTTSSELNMMLQTIADQASAGKVAVLVSDCVYSLTKGNAITQLDGLKFQTKNIFQPKINDLDVLILQMQGDYNGKYYDFNNKPTAMVGKRPYYIIIAAQKTQMNTLLRDRKYESMRDFASLNGYKNQAHITATNQNAATYFSILPTTQKSGQFSTDRSLSDKDCVKGIADCDARKGKIAFTVAVDLGSIYADEAYKTATSNYTLKGVDGFKITKIQGVSATNVQGNDKHFLQSATHIFTIEAANLSVAQQSLSLQFNAQLPAWIAASSTTNDSNTANDPILQAKTFGLQHLVEGIFEAYHQKGTNPAFFTISLGVKK